MVVPPAEGAPELGTDLGEQKLEFEVGELAAKLEHLIKTHKMRVDYTSRIFWMTVAWLACVLIGIILSGFKTVMGFELADSVLIAFLSSTTVTVVGLFVLVAKWLFPGKD